MKRILFLGLLLAVTLPAHAGWPPDETAGTVDYKDPANWPNDPDYGGMWKYWSFVPDKILNSVDDRTKRLGTGAHIDQAFAKTTGDPNVIIAVTDSGIEWESADILNRLYLNKGELKPPMGCPGADGIKFDVNGDGRFNTQDYTTATGHTLPAANMVCDQRVTDTNGNNVIDPEDLIKAFSDGKDDDGNGYVDDISGWDFFHNDNNPLDDTRFGHGTGSSNDAAAEANNMRSGLGVCPDCTLMELRCGDAFVPEINHWSMGVLYAVDQGASVVQISGGGGLSQPAFVRDALEYAYRNGVSVEASNSDLDSFQHNSPNTNNHIISVHAISPDGSSWDTSTTFFNFETCTNYGAQLMFSIPATGCSSEASGRFGGYMGLLYSAALKANLASPGNFAGDPNHIRRLTAEEARQLFIETVDTFYDPSDATNPMQFPTKNGFARRFGYGRPNMRAAVDAIFAGKIPPEVDLESPLWFDVLYPDKTPQVDITGRIAIRGMAQNPAGTTYDWVLEWAPGVDPDDSAFQMIGQAQMQSSAMEGKLASWDISGVTVNNAVPMVGSPDFQPDDPANVHVATLRLRATVHSSDPMLDGTKGESRKAVHVWKDPDLVAGYPKFIGSSGESSPKIVDIDGDGKRELIIADSSGTVHALAADGSEKPGWPAHTELLPMLDPMSHQGAGHAMAGAFTTGSPKQRSDWHSPVAASPGIGDIDGDGKPEIVVATWQGYVWAYHGDGSTVNGFPVELMRDAAINSYDDGHELEDGFWASPVLVDLNGDKKLDVVIAGMDARVYAWTGAGQPIAGFPVLVGDPAYPDDKNSPTPRQRERIMTTPAAGDLNKDGVPDLVVGTNENYDGHGRIYAIDGRGMSAPGGPFLPGWPASVVSTRFLPVVAQGIPITPAMADLNGDKVPEVIVSGLATVLKAYDATGKTLGAPVANTKEKYGANSNARNPVEFTFVSYPAVADLDNDGTPDFVEGTAGTDAALAFASGATRHDFEHHMSAWDSKTGLYKKGFPKVIEDWQFFSNAAIADVDGDGKPEVLAGSGGYFVHGWNVNGDEPTNFPKFTGGWVLSTPAVGDMDGDGKLELVATTRAGYVYAWHTQGKSTGRIDWASFHHDNMNTGNFDTLLDQGTPAHPGCSCDTMAGGAPVQAWLSLLGLALLALRRRRVR
jgi:MYXO-CTERM domain-containing protein